MMKIPPLELYASVNILEVTNLQDGYKGCEIPLFEWITFAAQNSSCTKDIQDDISCVNLFAKDPSGINAKDNTSRFFDQYNHRVAKINTNLGEWNDLRVYNGYMIGEGGALYQADLYYSNNIKGYSNVSIQNGQLEFDIFF